MHLTSLLFTSSVRRVYLVSTSHTVSEKVMEASEFFSVPQHTLQRPFWKATMEKQYRKVQEAFLSVCLWITHNLYFKNKWKLKNKASELKCKISWSTLRALSCRFQELNTGEIHPWIDPLSEPSSLPVHHLLNNQAKKKKRARTMALHTLHYLHFVWQHILWWQCSLDFLKC